MSRGDRVYDKATALSLASLGLPNLGRGQTSRTPPNFVIIFLDDSGWADFQPFASPDYKTPHVAQLAKEGCRFNNFYVPQAVCSASRAGLTEPSG